MDLIGIPTTRIDYMDNTKTLSVHVAESKGIVLALRMVERIASALASLHCIIFPDNQVAIRSMNNSKRQGGQDILIRAVPLLDELSYADTSGNEEADRAAKEAVISSQGSEAVLVVLGNSATSKATAAASKQQIRQALIREW
ncbi:MAG: hypothetical protein GOMPHAMPRED_002285 [Gomphillus americanus]|uniref:Uncharacterized protein n=1 Tax=Gomphillus americanus TaxID=1940652 RepID=A0A8H3FCZ3_9LECA|nr:MAG: hypothetical protein GOMPHAMPRED_002285 [Gomphillus americanus]